jgi:phospholipase C
MNHDWDMIDHFTVAQAYWTSMSTTTTQKQKFIRLLGTQQPAKDMDPEKVVVNLTNRALDPAAISVLCKGLNYAQTTSLKSNLKDAISGVE